MGYREAVIYVYSGTGNSYRVAAWMAHAARGAGAAVTVHPITSARPAGDIGGGETALLALVMPTHGFTAPWTVVRFALRLPRRHDTHAVAVATRAGTRIGPVYVPGFEGSATLLIACILALKGYRIRGAVGIDMPSNWIAVHPGLSPGTVAGIVGRARLKVARVMGTVLSGERCFGHGMTFLLGLLLLPISLAYMWIGRLFLGKLFFASDRCTGCGLCAAHCPNAAIQMRGQGGRRRPYWTFACGSCMRCMAYCPTQAVEASHLLGVGACLLASVLPTGAALTWVAARVPALAFLKGTPGWVLASVHALIVMGLLYPLFYRLLRIRWANRFFTYATLTRIYRRYHEPETTLQDLG